MANPGDRIIDIDGSWLRGVKSDADPGQIPVGYAYSAVNAINLGGVWCCRPGHDCIYTFPQGNLQGATLFRPKVGLEQIVAAVDGKLYAAPYPFDNFRVLDGIQFSPSAKQIFWQLTIQSAQRLTVDFDSAIELITPRVILFVQDDGETAPAFYDGAHAQHIRGTEFETPAGGPMAWVGDRLWVAAENQLFASDIGNGLSFREQVYLGGSTSFFFASKIKALVKTPSVESPQLMVLTETDGSIVQANIRNRDAWPTTPDFQKQVIEVGAASHRSALSHYGRIVWFSPSGIAIYDPATSGKLTTRLPVRDNEMLISKTQLAEDLSLVCAGAFGQWLLVSVPAEDTYNKHTWVLNHASIETLTDDSGPSWSGYWLGTRPVEWISGTIAGAERIYHVSADVDGNNRLWESFNPNRLDGGCPIMWALETRGYFGQTAAIQAKPPGTQCRMAWADVALAAISEDLDLGIFFAGGVRGSYKPILAKRISVERGSLSHAEEITATTQLFAFKPQSRFARTEDANQQSTATESGSCGIERKDLEAIDDSFQLLIVGHGPATIRWVRPFAFLVSEDLSGEPNACENEVPYNTIRYDGVGVESTDISAATLELSIKQLAEFTSSQTAAISQSGVTAIGIGSSESIVSQQAADRVAECIATRRAEQELSAVIPPTLSAGDNFTLPEPIPAPAPGVPATGEGITDSPGIADIVSTPGASVNSFVAVVDGNTVKLTWGDPPL